MIDPKIVCGAIDQIRPIVSLEPKEKKLELPEKFSRSRRNAQERSYVEIFLLHGFDWYETFGPSEQDVNFHIIVNQINFPLCR